MVVKMVRAGEERRLALEDFRPHCRLLRGKGRCTISTITSLLEPIMIILVGGIVLVGGFGSIFTYIPNFRPKVAMKTADSVQKRKNLKRYTLNAEN